MLASLLEQQHRYSASARSAECPYSFQGTGVRINRERMPSPDAWRHGGDGAFRCVAEANQHIYCHREKDLFDAVIKASQEARQFEGNEPVHEAPQLYRDDISDHRRGSGQPR